MKLAVLADIHANLAALEAVTADLEKWRPDAVLVGGDIVNRGPQPAECVAQIRERERAAGWRSIKGNHEDFVLSHRESDRPRRGPIAEIWRFSTWTYNRLPGADHRYLATLGDVERLLGPAGEEIRLVHASMIDNRTGIFPGTPDAVIRDRIAPAPAVFLAGHTHRPLVRRLDNTLVVNVGAVGSPFDGDWRAAYARLVTTGQGWHAEIVRLPYDRPATARLFGETGYLDQGGQMVRILLAELFTARSLIYGWIKRYQAAVLSGAMDLARSVDQYLEECGLTHVAATSFAAPVDG